jgi:hypothetical protein
VIYKIKAHVIEIVAIIHGRQDLKKHLPKRLKRPLKTRQSKRQQSKTK